MRLVCWVALQHVHGPHPCTRNQNLGIEWHCVVRVLTGNITYTYDTGKVQVQASERFEQIPLAKFLPIFEKKDKINTTKNEFLFQMC